MSEPLIKTPGMIWTDPITGGIKVRNATNDGWLAVAPETGSNANGYWRKWSDGTQECWIPLFTIPQPHTLTTWSVQGLTVYYLEKNMVLPVEFYENQYTVVASANPAGHSDFAASIAATSSTSFSLRIHSFYNFRDWDITNVSIYIIGRWKE